MNKENKASTREGEIGNSSSSMIAVCSLKALTRSILMIKESWILKNLLSLTNDSRSSNEPGVVICPSFKWIFIQLSSALNKAHYQTKHESTHRHPRQR